MYYTQTQTHTHTHTHTYIYIYIYLYIYINVYIFIYIYRAKAGILDPLSKNVLCKTMTWYMSFVLVLFENVYQNHNLSNTTV